MPLFEVELQAGGGLKKRGRSFNVAGIIEGSDQSLWDETVLVCAHYDHLGANTGKVFRGANDNGSGTAAVLELARMWKTSGERPRRSIMFVAFGSEEQGLFGSRYYAMNPLRPLAGTVTLNLDMVGSPERPNEIQFIAGSLSPELRQTVLLQNRTVGLRLTDEYESNLLFRSDHYAFLLAGAPAIQFFGGSGPDYHQPSDTVERLDFDKLVKVTRLTQLVAADLASSRSLPRLRLGLHAQLKSVSGIEP
jgi:Zn-dependent M28 family amino/carboxypeptidase